MPVHCFWDTSVGDVTIVGHKNMSVHMSPCFWDVSVGNVATVDECQPLSKTVKFNTLKVTRGAGTKNKFKKF